jgi:NTE family protein
MDPQKLALQRAAAPVHHMPDRPEPPTTDVALCLSGGGFRATLFHAGAFCRLNELGWLAQVNHISSVSGGSIAAGMLALKWSRLNFQNGVAQNLRDQVLDPLCDLTKTTIDAESVLRGIGPGSTGQAVAGKLRRWFGPATLADLPETPLFAFNSTSLQTGDLCWFAKIGTADDAPGRVPDPTIEIAVAVAASAAFPPFLSPLVVKLPAAQGAPETRNVLTDGGVFDNLGLETVWHDHKRIMISDAGQEFKTDDNPPAFWPTQILRVWNVTDNQVRSLRKHKAIYAFDAGLRDGPYWGIGSNIAKYELPDALPAPEADTLKLAKIKTRLASISAEQGHHLMNWGYAICDAAIRKHVIVDPPPPPPPGFPYPGGVGSSG